MRLIIINDLPYINGGASVIALTTALYLQKEGIDVTLFSGGTAKNEQLNNIVTTGQLDILNNPNRLEAIINGIWNYKARNDFNELLRDYNPSDTIIHVHTFNKVLSSSVIKLAIERSFKVVHTVHDYFLACPNGGFYNYQSESNCHLTPLSVDCIMSNCDSRNYLHKFWRIIRQAVQLYFGKVPSGINNYIFISEFSQKIIEPFIPEHSNSYYVPNPILIPKIKRINVSNNNEIAFIGRMSLEKGPHIFCEALKLLGFNGIFIGDGPILEEIKKKYPDNTYTGWLSRKELDSIMKTLKFLVFPSLLYETFGLVVAEAAALGIPSIVSQNTAAAEFVSDGITGLLTETGNVYDCKQKIEMMNENDCANELGGNAYEKYWYNPTTIDSHVTQLKSVYTKILNF